jgi:hypothetical protein
MRASFLANTQDLDNQVSSPEPGEWRLSFGTAFAKRLAIAAGPKTTSKAEHLVEDIRLIDAIPWTQHARKLQGSDSSSYVFFFIGFFRCQSKRSRLLQMR